MPFSRSARLPFDVPDAWPRHLQAVCDLADALPELTIVIDHLGKPPRGTAAMNSWEEALRNAAERPNVAAKLSGLQAPGRAFSVDALRPPVHVALDAFGSGRLMYGSDWPMTIGEGGYGSTWPVMSALISELSDSEQDEVLQLDGERRLWVGSTAMSDYLLEVEGISKGFPGVQALDDMHLNLRNGEVLALVGENGAGKSTLMKMLTGIYAPDAGDVPCSTASRSCPPTREHAQELGISIIHQEFNLMPDLTVAQNIFIGREPRTGGWLLSERALNRAARRAGRAPGICRSTRAPLVGDLTVAKQQMVEIAKALSYDARVLIMDEPTAALNDAEVGDLARPDPQVRARRTPASSTSRTGWTSCRPISRPDHGDPRRALRRDARRPQRPPMTEVISHHGRPDPRPARQSRSASATTARSSSRSRAEHQGRCSAT